MAPEVYIIIITTTDNNKNDTYTQNNNPRNTDEQKNIHFIVLRGWIMGCG